ncbi:MAG: IPT/TIG domain-containing protein [Deltaproteobacteria bacterium]|nr:IPT/TIG domain-containing protein [Deltaproteobacteria bacterium]
MRMLALVLVVAAGCSAPPAPELSLPSGLPLSALPTSQRALLRVTLEISESTLPETEVSLADDLMISGDFNLQNVGDGERSATLRVYGRFSETSEEVLLGRAIDQIQIAEGATTGLDFKDVAFASCDVGVDSACSLEFDRNRNGVTNMLDLAPVSATGGRGIDPAPQPEFLSVSPETLQFPSGIRLGQFARQVIVIENRGEHPIRVDSLDVSGGQGVAMSLFDPFGGVATIARRSVPGAEIEDEIQPGEELLVAVSFAPVNSFLTTAGIQVTATDVVTNVAQANRVKVIANVDGTLRPRPEDYASPDIGPTLDVGSGSVPASAFPANELFSGQEITSTGGLDRGLPFVGSRLVATLAGAPFSMPADRAFVVDVPQDTRLAVSLSGLGSDIDLAVVGLDAQNAVASVLVASRHPETGAESVDLLNDGDEPLRVAIVMGRVELDAAPSTVVVGGLSLSTPAPFQLSAELSRGPEFSDSRGIEPASGAIEGNSSFTLRGRGFQPGAVVTFADFVALDVRVTVDPVTEESIIEGLTPHGSSEVGKNPATIVVANPPADRGGDGQAATLPEAYLYDPPAARLDVVLPDVAPITGAPEPFAILGSFFSDAQGPPRVNFGDAIYEATYINTTTLTVQPGPAAAGTVIVTLQNQIRPGVYGARSNGLAFRFAAPTGPIPVLGTLSSIEGSADGDDDVTLSGSGFGSGTRVLFGTLEATVTAVDAGAISVRTPAVEADGTVTVSVINPDGQSSTLRNAFTYFFPQPTIAGLLPQRVPTSGGTLIIATGTSLRAGLTAVFRRDGLEFTPLSLARASTTSLLVTTPPLAAGTATLVITNPDGQVGTSQPIEVFEPQGNGPSIVFVDPASGPLQGQNVITVAGRDFSAAGVKVVINGVSVDVPVEKEAAAGLDRLTVVVPPALTPGSVPIVIENADGQSTAGAYLYVQVDVPRIDEVRPSALHILPGTEIQVLGDVFGGFSSSLQVFLGAGAVRQALPLVARSDGLVIARVIDRLPAAGPIALTLTDGSITLNRTLNVVVPTIAFADERGDEIEVVGDELAGDRLQTFCAGGDGYRPVVASDEALVVRRDARLDVDCPFAPVAPRPISLLYEGNQRFAPAGALVTDETDGDGDGVGSRDDADDGEPCVPNFLAAVCDFDRDGALPPFDVDNLDPCAPDSGHPLCTDDDDGDGFVNAVDPSDVNPCLPDANALSCADDADGDGVINPFDPADADPCAPNPASSACNADSDGDGVTDTFDPVDDSPCVPNTTAVNCDADNDGALPPADSDNADPCTPNDQHVLCSDDDDGDGTPNATDSDDRDACVPAGNALACTNDDDGDGALNPFDPDDVDPCAPNPASSACDADSDGDDVTDAFDPVDNNACVPNTEATNCDADGDGVLPPSDASNSDPCVPNNQHPLCTDDDDNDGVGNAIDGDDVDACVPDAQALACSADSDDDGVINPFDPADADPCSPNPASPACSSDADRDGVSDTFDPVDDNACVPNTTATNCDADGDLAFPPADTNNANACVPNDQAATCTDDDDDDGTLNAIDADDSDACVPSSEALACTADSDGDGVANPFDSADADPCAPNPASSACSSDVDGDGVSDVFDPVDDNACVPDTTAANCDADGDLSFPPADTSNTDACAPSTQAQTCTADDDGDGTLNAIDPNDDDACVPDANALACANDDDDDGVLNPFDAADTDPCAPNPASPACSADSDDDGVTDAFDPADGDPCVPNLGATNCDDDDDGAFPPADPRNTDPCVPDSNHTLCEDDDDRDGVSNPNDADDSDGCVPALLSLTCDNDDDGVPAPFDANESNGCVPDLASATCVICGDGLLRGSEACDDDNGDDADGCSADCAVEPGFTCSGQPSECLEVCGDSIQGPREECDDGNVDDGDGCSSLCLRECGDGEITTQVPPQLESITIKFLATSCGGQSVMNFRINGALVASPLGPAGCTCGPGIQTLVMTNPAVLATVVDGTNTFSVQGAATDGLSWATAIIDFGPTSTEVAIFDAPGGGNDALNHNPDLCGSGRTSNVNATVTPTLRDTTETCDDGGVDDGDGCSSTCALEGGFSCAGEPSTCIASQASCLVLLRDFGQTASGIYSVDPDGSGPAPSSDVFCDMTTDGGGYTFLKVAQTLQDFQAEAFCASKGMRMIIPRTQAHMRAAVAIARNAAIGPDASDDYMRMLGVYPFVQGGRCTGQPMNSVTSNPATCQWGAADGSSFFIHNASFGEPNGDNCTTCSMNYAYNGVGDVAGFNDLNAHISSSRFICDVGDKR